LDPNGIALCDNVEQAVRQWEELLKRFEIDVRWLHPTSFIVSHTRARVFEIGTNFYLIVPLHSDWLKDWSQDGGDFVKPEETARKGIDDLLRAAGWKVQDFKDLNLGASLGVAVREFPLRRDAADYMLFVDRKAVGVIEAKPAGTTLGGVAAQSAKYTENIPDHIACVSRPLPFSYESTGIETYFRDVREPDSRSRHVFAFHKPETLQEWAFQKTTLRERLRSMPPLIERGLWDCQIEAVKKLEESFSKSRPRALIQMATGSGKTRVAVTNCYRLVRFAGARRILFLVDRSNLGRKTYEEFKQYVTPDDGRKFTELYNVQHLKSNMIDKVSKVCISTIQRVYSMLRGEEFNPQNEEESGFEMAIDGEPREVAYNPQVPIETFDFIITDECHRSIYNLWRQVLEYFDAFIVGLTATPSKQTLGFFDQNLVTEYPHERAVADGVNVGYDVYRIRTAISEEGSKVDAGLYVDKRDKLTRKMRWELLDEDLEYEANDLDRDIVAPDQIRMIIRVFRDKLFTEIFPGREHVPKTIVFAKDDSHAEDILHIIREEFGKGNEFCKKITYRTPEDPERLIASFRNSYNPRIVVTVDMISTGTDIKPVECLLFMRDVKSRVYFEQMKGRGTRVISPTDMKSVTPDTSYKTHFVIVDAVGVTENDKTDSRPLERKPYVSFEQLLNHVQLGKRDEDTLSSLASRLSRMELKLTSEDQREIRDAAEGKTLGQLVNGLLDAIDSDVWAAKATEMFHDEQPSEEHIAAAGESLAKEACKPYDNPKLRRVLIEIKKKSEQTIDTVSQDEVLYAGYDDEATDRAKQLVSSFKEFIEENKDELIALQIIFSKSYGQRKLTYDAIRELADSLKKPPYGLTSELLWDAYERLERAKVRRAGPQRLLTDIISLVRYALGESEVLAPFYESVEERFSDWIAEQERVGKEFNPEQLEWLEMIRDHIAQSMSIQLDDFENVPFQQRGGAYRALELFGEDLGELINELNEVLTS